MLKNILEPAAMERLFRIQYVKPDKFEAIKTSLLNVNLIELLIWINKNQS